MVENNIANDDWGFLPGTGISPLPLISPHWPGVGRYVGVVDDMDKWDTQPWQRRRVYQDEVDAMNPKLDIVVEMLKLIDRDFRKIERLENVKI